MATRFKEIEEMEKIRREINERVEERVSFEYANRNDYPIIGKCGACGSLNIHYSHEDYLGKRWWICEDCGTHCLDI